MKKNQGDGQRRQAAATGLAALTLLAAPWQASAQEAAMGTVVVTAVTDIMGFFCFLGLATLILLH